ncbi:putative transporterC [Vanrija pseudolonga]|uniref:Purtative transporterC n=1 Tax=Vanrija pseudolonga TaxID=143232 RepID=A0AAF0Y0W9_9TREE|nr:purtative transporterC [Vanrija pseudolonga]
MSHLEDEKRDLAHIEDGKAPVVAHDRHLQLELPASLQHLDEAEMSRLDKKITRKIDFVLMPILIILYVLNFLDRNNISTAKIGGMTKDLHMNTEQFGTAVAVLFAGYVSLQIPSNMLASRIKWPGTYICVMCAAWGVVSGCTGAVQSYSGLCAIRVILGFTEAAFFPGALFLLSTFYTKQQLAFRTGILYSGSQLGNAFGGLFAAAILTLDKAHHIAGWRWLFIVEGSMTVGLAIVFAFIIPNRPSNYRWLTPVEHARLAYRLEADKGTRDGSEEMSNWEAFKLAVTDIRAWMVCAALTLNFVASAVTNFFPVVISTLGFNRTTSLAITAPPYIFCIFCIVLNGWHSDKTQERAFHVIGPFIITIVANVLAVATTHTAARYVAMMLMPASFYSATILLLSWISTTVVGPSAKRAVALAMINAIANTSNIWTSYLYFNAPRYVVAFCVNIGASVLLIILVLFIRWYLVQQNKRLDRGEDLGIHGPTEVQRENGYRFKL